LLYRETPVKSPFGLLRPQRETSDTGAGHPYAKVTGLREDENEVIVSSKTSLLKNYFVWKLEKWGHYDLE